MQTSKTSFSFQIRNWRNYPNRLSVVMSLLTSGSFLCNGKGWGRLHNPDAGETVSHLLPSLELIMPVLVSLFALVNGLPVRPENTCCLKCKCRSLFVPQTPVKSLSVLVGQTGRERGSNTQKTWNQASPSLALSNRSGGWEHVCGNAWFIQPLKPELMKSQVAAAEHVSTDKSLSVSLVHLP